MELVEILYHNWRGMNWYVVEKGEEGREGNISYSSLGDAHSLSNLMHPQSLLTRHHALEKIIDFRSRSLSDIPEHSTSLLKELVEPNLYQASHDFLRTIIV